MIAQEIYQQWKQPCILQLIQGDKMAAESIV